MHLYRALDVSPSRGRNTTSRCLKCLFWPFLLFKGQSRSGQLKASCQNMQADQHAHMRTWTDKLLIQVLLQHSDPY